MRRRFPLRHERRRWLEPFDLDLGIMALDQSIDVRDPVGRHIDHDQDLARGDVGFGGWPRRRAILWNFASGLTFLFGAVFAYAASLHVDVTPLILFGAGNFIYIAASDLIPEFKSDDNPMLAALHFGCFGAGVAALLALAYLFGQAA
jgi:hypothetical protein